MGFLQRLKSVLLIREEAYWCVVVCECSRQLMRGNTKRRDTV